MKKILIALIAACSLSACGGAGNSPTSANLGGKSQLSIRQTQTRYFETGDRRLVMQAVLSTLQDLGFVIDKASFDVGVITGTRLDGYRLRMTVAVWERNPDSTQVRANAQLGGRLAEDGEMYQRFFDSLAQSLFLQAHLVE